MSSSRRQWSTPGLPASPVRDRRVPRLRPAPGGGSGPGEPARALARSDELWLAIHLPGLVLEALDFRAPPPVRAATIVVDREESGRVVRDCDAAAHAAGVRPGMALNSALALRPDLEVHARDPVAEHALLDAVAACGGDFTPRAALEPPDAVLLEVRGSLRLFGGVRALVERLRARLHAAGLSPRIALAPTPLAALWFARAGEQVALRRRDTLPGRLGALPLGCTRWDARHLESLATMGVRTVGDCLRLPRDGFARRFGVVALRDLERATGRAADPRASCARRERYAARRDLEPEVERLDLLGRVVEPMIEGLARFLRRRVRAVEAIEIGLVHRDVTETRLVLRFGSPVAAAPRMAALLEQRLAATSLPAPVRAVRLRSGPLVAARDEARDLFARSRGDGGGVPELVERLRARLGDDAVHGLRVVAEHRPEAAYATAEIRTGRAAVAEPCATGAVPPNRPLWLLAEPLPLAGDEQPSHEGLLEIESGPERIESGWWDGRDVRRDYYVARNRAGARLWVYRECGGPRGWFLHGVFG